jgi:hypothetical protein
MIIPDLLLCRQQKLTNIPILWDKSGLFYKVKHNLAIFSRVFPVFFPPLTRVAPAFDPCLFATLSGMNTFTGFLPGLLQVDCGSVPGRFTMLGATLLPRKRGAA